MKKFVKLSKAEMKNVLGGGVPPGGGMGCYTACFTPGLGECTSTGQSQSWCANYMDNWCTGYCKNQP